MKGTVGELGEFGLIRELTSRLTTTPAVRVGPGDDAAVVAAPDRRVVASTDILLDAVPRHVAMAEVQRRILAVPGVAAVHDLHVWTVVNGVVAMSGHAVVPELDSHPDVLDGIRTEMSALGIGHVTIQLEVADECEDVRAAAPLGHAGGHGHAH